MPAKRIIACLDVKDGRVVKGVRFEDHRDVGDPADLAQFYRDEGADELVIYDITASAERRTIDYAWLTQIARHLDIPLCVAGGIRSVEQAIECLENGADKISINSPALERPDFINELAAIVGSQCVVVGVDSRLEHFPAPSIQPSGLGNAPNQTSRPLPDRKTAHTFPESGLEGGDWFAHQYTGDARTLRRTPRLMLDWIVEAQTRGAGEIVLNCMDSDGTRAGYDIPQLQGARARLSIPLVASGGAGDARDFARVFAEANVSGALAAGALHARALRIPQLKQTLLASGVEVRP